MSPIFVLPERAKFKKKDLTPVLDQVTKLDELMPWRYAEVSA